MPSKLKSATRFALTSLLAAPFCLAHASLELERLGTYSQPDPAAAFDEGASEIVAFDKKSERLFVTNGDEGTVDIISISDPAAPALVGAINVIDNPAFGGFVGGGANSVAVHKGLVAAAIEADTVTDPGIVAFFDSDGNFLSMATLCALPDMVTFDSKGKTVLVACEGEPDDGVDPEGAIAVLEVRKDGEIKDVRITDFNAFDDDVSALRSRTWIWVTMKNSVG